MHDQDNSMDEVASDAVQDVVMDPNGSGDVMSILQDVERQFDRLRDVQNQHATEVASLAERSAQLEDLGRQLDTQRQELERQSEELTRQTETLTQDRSTLEGEREAAETRAEQLHSEQQTLAQHAEDLKHRETHFEQERTEFGDAQQRHAEVTAQLESVQTQLEESRQRAESTEQEAMELIHEMEEQRDALQAKVTEHEGLIEQQQTQIADLQQKLDVTGQKLQRFAEMLKEQGPQLERGAAAIAMVDHEKQQVERLARELAEAKLSADPEELRNRDERIKELTEALHQSRGQAVGEPDSFELEQRNSELQSELDQIRIQLEQAEQTSRDAQSQLEGQVNQISGAESAERQFEIEKAELEAKLHELDVQLQEARAQQAAAESAAGDQEAATEARMLRSENMRLVEERDELRKNERELQAALEKKQKIEAREGASSDSADDLAQIDKQMQELMRRQVHLEEVRHKLAVSERRMIRRGAGGRAMSGMFSLLMIAALNALAAWVAADHVFPVDVVASATVRANSESPSDLTDEALLKWKRWHTELIYASEFQATLAERMGNLRIDALRTQQAVTGMIVRDLTVDAAQPGYLTFSLSGTDPAQTSAVLDVLVSTIAAESKRMTSIEEETVHAVALNEKQEGGRLRYSSVGPIAFEDSQLIRAAPIFGGLLLVSMVFIALTYGRLVRAKRVFDEEEDPMAEPEDMAEVTATLHQVS
jgi:hypothetical protein